MPPTSVRITTVTTRAEYPVANRISYQVRLSCGCEWWEHRAMHEAPPIVGAPAYCCAMHAKTSDAEGAEGWCHFVISIVGGRTRRVVCLTKRLVAFRWFTEPW